MREYRPGTHPQILNGLERKNKSDQRGWASPSFDSMWWTGIAMMIETALCLDFLIFFVGRTEDETKVKTKLAEWTHCVTAFTEGLHCSIQYDVVLHICPAGPLFGSRQVSASPAGRHGSWLSKFHSNGLRVQPISSQIQPLSWVHNAHVITKTCHCMHLVQHCRNLPVSGKSLFLLCIFFDFGIWERADDNRIEQIPFDESWQPEGAAKEDLFKNDPKFGVS